MTSIRGAITVPENTAAAILAAAEELLGGIIRQNGLAIHEITAIIFSATQDLTGVYPAAAARNMGIVDAGLFCVQEMYVEGSLPRCIRALVHVEQGKRQQDMRHVYLRDAVRLRPDLAGIPSAEASGEPSADISGEISAAPPSIAIDGPSGAGKSTAAKGVAAALGMVYIDTGAMYRAVALYCLRRGVDTSDEGAVEAQLGCIDIDIRHSSGEQRLFLNGEDVTDALRTQQVAEGSSKVAAYLVVRQRLVAFQRGLAAKRSVVMDGRDIGTVVLPDAAVKIFLTAGTEERTRRRMSELRQKNLPADYETVRREILIRDERDSGRAASPLCAAADALELNSDGMSPEQMVEEILGVVRGKM